MKRLHPAGEGFLNTTPRPWDSVRCRTRPGCLSIGYSGIQQPIQQCRVVFGDGFLNRDDLGLQFARAQRQGENISRLDLVGRPGRFAVDQYPAGVTGFVRDRRLIRRDTFRYLSSRIRISPLRKITGAALRTAPE